MDASAEKEGRSAPDRDSAGSVSRLEEGIWPTCSRLRVCGVGAVVADQVASWVRDPHEDPGDELHRVDPLTFGRPGLVVPPLGT